jgi:hypothetical protein
MALTNKAVAVAVAVTNIQSIKPHYFAVAVAVAVAADALIITSI